MRGSSWFLQAPRRAPGLPVTDPIIFPKQQSSVVCAVDAPTGPERALIKHAPGLFFQMNLEETRAANDLLREKFTGGRILMSRAVWDLETHMRGRMLHRLNLYSRFEEDSDHSEGVFIFAGYSFFFEILMENGERTLTVYLDGDLLLQESVRRLRESSSTQEDRS